MSRTYATPPSELDLSAEEITLLLAQYANEPWGDRRADLRAALQTQFTMASSGQRLKLEDVCLRFGPPVKDTPEQFRKKLFAIFGNRTARNPKP